VLTVSLVDGLAVSRFVVLDYTLSALITLSQFGLELAGAARFSTSHFPNWNRRVLLGAHLRILR